MQFMGVLCYMQHLLYTHTYMYIHTCSVHNLRASFLGFVKGIAQSAPPPAPPILLEVFFDKNI